MFNSLYGKITEKTDNSLFLLSSGIEWELAVNSFDGEDFPAVGEEARAFVWLYHRDDSMRLFGFASEKSREVFLELLKVEGIGPRGAQKIMGGIGHVELVQALESEDLGRLQTVPGVGKKTAQKMLLALKGRLVQTDANTDATQTQYPELLEALVQMGFDKKMAAKVLEKIAREDAQEIAGLSSEEGEKILFKKAIVLLSAGS